MRLLLDSRQAGHWRASTLSLPSRSAAIPSELWLRKRFSKEQTHHAAWFNGTAGDVLPFRCANFSGWFTPRSDGRRPRSTRNVVPSPFIKPYARTRSRASDATDLSCLACVLALSFRCWWLAVFSTALQDSCEPVNRLWFLLTAFACYA
jgi:hypothetical protein